MTIGAIKELLDAQPFQPFVMHLADGRSLTVPHRDFVARAPSGRTLVIYQPDDRFHIVDLLLVTGLEIKSNGHSQDVSRGTGKA